MANKRVVGRGSRGSRGLKRGVGARRPAHLKWCEKAYSHLTYWWRGPYFAGWNVLPKVDFTGQLLGAMQATEKVIGQRAATRIKKTGTSWGPKK